MGTFQNMQRENEQPSQTLIQPQLEIGKEDDEHEKEANSVADKVMRMADPEEKKKKMTDDDAGKVRMMIDDKDEKEKMIDEDDGKVRMMKNAAVIHKMTDGSSGGVAAPQNVEQGINSSKGNGQSLPAETQQELGGKMDADFSDVKIHTGGNAAEMNKQIGAKAFTHGNDIYFNEGQYNPSSGQGKQLLAHELTHTVQQGGNVKRKIQRAETDTRVGTANLLDCREDINTHVNEIISKGRNASKGDSKELISYVYDKLGEWGSLGHTIIEDWVRDSLPTEKKHQPSTQETKYAGVPDAVSMFGPGKLWSQSTFPILNPSIKIGKILVGSDKLGHFFQQGKEYYDISKSQMGGEAAAVKYGEDSEVGGFGLDRTGVYSNADLATNKRGMGFWSDLITNPNMTFDIASYITNSWNEEFNPNFYSKEVGKVVWKNLIQSATQCAMSDLDYESVLLTNAKASLTVSDTIIKGTLSYLQPKTLKDTITISLNGSIEYFTTKDTNAITGVKLTFTWSTGKKSGTGTLKSIKESKLFGMLFEKEGKETKTSHEVRIIL